MKQLLILALLTTLVTGCKQQPEFPLTDLHIHLKGDLTIEEALKKSEEEGIKYGIAVNCGLGFPVQTDAQADSFFTFMQQYPQFYVGMQAEGREWVDLFSEETFSKFDYVFTDAMTFTDAKGRRNRIWIENETWIDDEEAFMDYLVETIETILNTEPIDIYVNPTYLPVKMAGRYNHFWTAERMDRVIDAARENGIAIEINNRFKIPSAKFIKRAKKAGVKFTMGTNNVDKNFDGSSYTKKMIRECGLTANDFWLPEMNKR
ncbi:MAG: hypothetical protein K9H26_07595 [Prolixibacteraceae bacterium]|nr:hypothetical protein [Prolixibacteraceae bacterium]